MSVARVSAFVSAGLLVLVGASVVQAGRETTVLATGLAAHSGSSHHGSVAGQDRRGRRPSPTRTRPTIRPTVVPPVPVPPTAVPVPPTAVPVPPTAEPDPPQSPTATPGTPTASGSHGHTGVDYDPALVPTGSAGSPLLRVSQAGLFPPDAKDGTSAFRTVCQFSHMLPDDPIVAPGSPGASHLHVFWGNTSTDASSTEASIAGTGNGTCRGGIGNRTAYWAPAVIDTRTGAPQAPRLIHVYYKSGYNGLAPGQMTMLPQGLRMIAGDYRASSWQGWNTVWKCSGTPAASHESIPDCPVGEDVEMMLMFPQCWDGVRLDSVDHKQHMAYPSGGTCPATHPVAVPQVTYTMLYPVTVTSQPSAWRLASDGYDPSLPGGYSIHGDWFDGWDPALKRTWTQQCLQAGKDCSSHMLGDGRIIEGDV